MLLKLKVSFLFLSLKILEKRLMIVATDISVLTGAKFKKHRSWFTDVYSSLYLYICLPFCWLTIACANLTDTLKHYQQFGKLLTGKKEKNRQLIVCR